MRQIVSLVAFVIFFVAVALATPPGDRRVERGPSAKQCPTGQVATQNPAKDFETNGCGSGGFSIRTDDNFTPCCDRHDACYSVCGVPKEFCEARFKKCLMEVCKKKGPEKSSCESNANMFHMGANMMGGASYAEGQKDWCMCVEGDKTSEAYQNGYLEAAKKIYKKKQEFWQNHEADTEEQIDKYIELQKTKHSGNGKEAKLLNSLLEKYPETMVRVKNEPSSGGDL